MSNQWRIIFFVLILVLSLPSSAMAAGPVTTAQHATDPTSSNTTETSEPPDPQPIQQSSTSFDITPTADNDTIPWRQNRLPVFVGDTINFQAESTLDGYELVNVSWKTSGPASVTSTTENGSTALTQFERHGKTTLQVTTTLHNDLFDRTIEQTSTYTLIATSDDFTVDEFSVNFEGSPSRWDTAAVYAHLHDLPEIHHNMSQRLPLPSRVNLAYMTYSEIQDRCGGGAYACVDQSNENTIYMPYDVGKYEASQITTYRHEITHVAQSHGMDMSYRQQWQFIAEGHAEYEQSNQFNLRPLDEKPSQQELREFQVDYNAADLFVSAFVAEYGYQSLRQMIEFSRDNSVEQAMQKTTNESFNSFYDRWAPTNASRGPNAVRTVSSTSSRTDVIHHKPRFVYYNENLTALGFGPYEFGDIATVSWDTNNDGESEYSGQTVRWAPSEAGEKAITVTYRNGNASLSRTQTVMVPNGDSGNISDYTNRHNIVDARGLQEAAADFRNGEVGSAVLLDASAAFRNGSPVS